MPRLPTRVVQAIIAKDLRDALRDGRLVLGVLVIVGLALVMGLGTAEDARSRVTLAYSTQGETQLPEMMQAVGRDVLKFDFNRIDGAEALRDAVREKDADVSLLIPDDFDASVARGAEPPVTVILADPPSPDGKAAAATIEPALRALAGQNVPATVTTESVEATYRRGEAAVDEVGMRRFTALVGILAVMAWVGLFMVPMILAEETEKKTIEALAMATSYRVIVAAKALVGVIVAIALTVAMLVPTDLAPAEPLTLALALGLTALLFVGIGLLLGGLFTATVVNTWSGLLILALLAPAFMVGNPPPWPGIDTVFSVIPSSQAIRLALNGVSGTSLFPDAWLSVTVLTGWLFLVFAVLVRRLSIREA